MLPLMRLDSCSCVHAEGWAALNAPSSEITQSNPGFAVRATLRVADETYATFDVFKQVGPFTYTQNRRHCCAVRLVGFGGKPAVAVKGHRACATV